MSNSPLRRAQLVAPFGVGAMVVARDGTSLIACGVDHWYKRESSSSNIKWEEFRVKEWRLEKILGVDHFRQPPDYRIKRKGEGEDIPNLWLTIPFLRFPKWHYCTTCGRLEELPLTLKEKVKCRDCESKGRTRYLVQVPLVAICEHGHIQDFPWREWVHRSVNPDCQKPMRLVGTGGATLAGQKVKCDCGAERSLSGATTAYSNGGTFLTNELDKNTQYKCQGMRPWHGTEDKAGCEKPLRGSLRSASNVYYPQVFSSIYLPRSDENNAPFELISILEEPRFLPTIKLLSKSGLEIKPEHLRNMDELLLLQPFTDNQIKACLQIILAGEQALDSNNENEVESDDPVTKFRREEFNILRTTQEKDELRITLANLGDYNRNVAKYFSRVTLIDKLRETRALAGFARIYPENDQTLDDMKALIWRDVPGRSKIWLPAYVVYGEGIYLEFDEARLQEWLEESGEQIDMRVRPLVEQYQQIQQDRKLRDRPIGPRFVLLHTFAHLLINQLTFECGYSSAALRERLYVSDNENAPMAGVMIYTAAGDAEGTLGGLVRMGKPGNLELVIQKALENARWCSADPVCMELGSSGGQGPNSCNLAACHNCALVPETACEEFNMFLDRALVVGDHNNRKLGFFNS